MCSFEATFQQFSERVPLPKIIAQLDLAVQRDADDAKAAAAASQAAVVASSGPGDGGLAPSVGSDPQSGVGSAHDTGPEPKVVSKAAQAMQHAMLARANCVSFKVLPGDASASEINDAAGELVKPGPFAFGKSVQMLVVDVTCFGETLQFPWQKEPDLSPHAIRRIQCGAKMAKTGDIIVVACGSRFDTAQQVEILLQQVKLPIVANRN